MAADLTRSAATVQLTTYKVVIDYDSADAAEWVAGALRNDGYRASVEVRRMVERDGMVSIEAERDLGSSAAKGRDDWRTDITMPDDETQTLADVLDVMRSNNLQRQAAFVEWFADEWYDAKAELRRRRTWDWPAP